MSGIAASGEVKRLTCPFEIKALADDGTIEGYGAVFGNIDHSRDIVMPGAFTRWLGENGGKAIPMLWVHDMRRPIGVWEQLREDVKGLFCKGRIVRECDDGKDAYALAKAGAVTGLSIGYRTRDDSYDETRQVRLLKDVDLLEVSPVPIPMNDQARMTAVKTIKTIREFEDFLRDEGGFSHAAAKAIAARGFKAMPDPREEDGGLNGLLQAARDARAVTGGLSR